MINHGLFKILLPMTRLQVLSFAVTLASESERQCVSDVELQTWSIPRLHRVRIPAIVSFLWCRHSMVVLPGLRYHSDNSLTHTQTLTHSLRQVR